MADHPITQGVIATYCHLLSVTDLLVSELCQPDLPHFFDLYLRNYDMEQFACDGGDVEGTRQYYGLWRDSFVSMEGPPDSPDESTVEFILVCPQPNIFSSGAHRAMMGYWYEGERYVLAMEEGAGFHDEPVYISAFTDEGMSRIKDGSYVEGMLGSAAYAVSGIRLLPKAHNFNVIVSDDPAALLSEGCTPSPLMYRY